MPRSRARRSAECHSYRGRDASIRSGRRRTAKHASRAAPRSRARTTTCRASCRCGTAAGYVPHVSACSGPTDDERSRPMIIRERPMRPLTDLPHVHVLLSPRPIVPHDLGASTARKAGSGNSGIARSAQELDVNSVVDSHGLMSYIRVREVPEGRLVDHPAIAAAEGCLGEGRGCGEPEPQLAGRLRAREVPGDPR